VGKKAENSPRVMIRINSSTTAMTKRMSPRTVVFQLFKIRSFILFSFSQVNLDFVNAFEDFLCIGFDVGPYDVEVPGVIGLM